MVDKAGDTAESSVLRFQQSDLDKSKVEGGADVQQPNNSVSDLGGVGVGLVDRDEIKPTEG
jgi:hypothetical protein